jgi:ribosomal protein L37AE/L43A
MLPNSFVRPCAQCGADIIAPEWSEYLSTGCVRNVWTCEACGYNFEDSIYFSAPLEGVGLGPDA